jgi:squalene-hopene/tetraprenyl-beta-curcumene cyclase
LAALGQEAITESNGTVHNWRKELIAKLQSLQRSDGSWVNKEDRWWESNANLVTAYAVLALEETLK